MIKITFPDGSVREYEAGATGLQIAESISQRLAQDVVACGVNGETTELNRPINEDATINLYKFDDEQGKHAFWHTSAHLLAEALQELYPGIQFGFGPAVENGFFYDVLLPDGKRGAQPFGAFRRRTKTSRRQRAFVHDILPFNNPRDSFDFVTTKQKAAFIAAFLMIMLCF